MKPRILERKTVFKGKLLELENIRIDADTITYEVFSRPKGFDGVNVLAVTKDRELILVREFRPAIDSYVLSLVCGAIEYNQTPEAAARRELLEETGYSSGNLVNLCAKVGGIPASPGVWRERVYTVAAFDCEKTAVGGGLASEQEKVETILVPLPTIAEFLETMHVQGCDIHAVHAALGLLYLHQPRLWKELMK